MRLDLATGSVMFPSRYKTNGLTLICILKLYAESFQMTQLIHSCPLHHITFRAVQVLAYTEKLPFHSKLILSLPFVSLPEFYIIQLQNLDEIFKFFC